jgi:hypothetical protein
MKTLGNMYEHMYCDVSIVVFLQGLEGDVLRWQYNRGGALYRGGSVL